MEALIKQKYLTGVKGKNFILKQLPGGKGWYWLGIMNNARGCLTVEYYPEKFKFSFSFPFNFLSKLVGWLFELPSNDIKTVEIRKHFSSFLLTLIPKPDSAAKISFTVKQPELWLKHLKNSSLKLEVIGAQIEGIPTKSFSPDSMKLSPIANLLTWLSVIGAIIAVMVAFMAACLK